MKRLNEYLIQTLLLDQPSFEIKKMVEFKTLVGILPEIYKTVGFEQKNPHHNLTVFEHILEVLDNTPKVLEIRMAALLHDIGKPYVFEVDENGIGHFYKHEKVSAEIAERFLQNFDFSAQTKNEIILLVRLHMSQPSTTKGWAKLVRKHGIDFVRKLYLLQVADGRKPNISLDDLKNIYS